MCKYIGIECVAANALIELFENQDKSEVTFEALFKYGMQVVHLLEERTGEEILLLFSQRYQYSMMENYSDYFDFEYSSNGNGIFKLKGDDKGKVLVALKERFRWTMSKQFVQAFKDSSSLKELGIDVA